MIGDATMHAPLNVSNPTCEIEDNPENRKLGSVHHGVALPLCPVATSGDVAKAMHPTMTSPLAFNSASDNQSDGITAGQTHLAPIVFGIQNVGNPDQGRCGIGGTINMVVESSVGDQREEVIICAVVVPDCVATIMVDVENAGWPKQAITAGGIHQAEQKVNMVETDPARSQMAMPETTDSVSKQTPEEAEVVVPAKPSSDDLLDLWISVGAISSPVFDARAGPACFSITVDGLVNLLRHQLDKKEDIINKQANEIAELVKNGREQADEIAHLEEYIELLIESAYNEDGYPLSKSEKCEGKWKARTEGGTEDTQDGGFDGIRSSFENLAYENIHPRAELAQVSAACHTDMCDGDIAADVAESTENAIAHDEASAQPAEAMVQDGVELVEVGVGMCEGSGDHSVGLKEMGYGLINGVSWITDIPQSEAIPSSSTIPLPEFPGQAQGNGMGVNPPDAQSNQPPQIGELQPSDIDWDSFSVADALANVDQFVPVPTSAARLGAAQSDTFWSAAKDLQLPASSVGNWTETFPTSAVRDTTDNNPKLPAIECKIKPLPQSLQRENILASLSISSSEGCPDWEEQLKMQCSSGLGPEYDLIW